MDTLHTSFGELAYDEAAPVSHEPSKSTPNQLRLVEEDDFTVTEEEALLFAESVAIAHEDKARLLYATGRTLVADMTQKRIFELLDAVPELLAERAKIYHALGDARGHRHHELEEREFLVYEQLGRKWLDTDGEKPHLRRLTKQGCCKERALFVEAGHFVADLAFDEEPDLDTDAAGRALEHLYEQYKQPAPARAE